MADGGDLDGRFVLAVAEEEGELVPAAVVLDRVRVIQLAVRQVGEGRRPAEGSRGRGQAEQLLFDVVLERRRPGDRSSTACGARLTA
jgi:hypothetical protein